MISTSSFFTKTKYDETTFYQYKIWPDVIETLDVQIDYQSLKCDTKNNDQMSNPHFFHI